MPMYKERLYKSLGGEISVSITENQPIRCCQVGKSQLTPEDEMKTREHLATERGWGVWRRVKE